MRLTKFHYVLLYGAETWPWRVVNKRRLTAADKMTKKNMDISLKELQMRKSFFRQDMKH